MKGYYYLATPYSMMPGDEAHSLQWRYDEARRITAALLQMGTWVFSPIVHCHPLVQDNNLPTGFEFWNAYDATMIVSSVGVLVATMPCEPPWAWARNRSQHETWTFVR